MNKLYICTPCNYSTEMFNFFLNHIKNDGEHENKCNFHTKKYWKNKENIYIFDENTLQQKIKQYTECYEYESNIEKSIFIDYLKNNLEIEFIKNKSYYGNIHEKNPFAKNPFVLQLEPNEKQILNNEKKIVNVEKIE